jgi:ribonuclease Y
VNFLSSLASSALDQPLFAQASNSGSNLGYLYVLIGLAIGAAVMFGINILQGRDARSQSKRLLEQSKLDCDNMVKTAELEKKEKLLQLQSKFDSENNKVREELRKREQSIERKEESLKQTADDVRKQEKLVETTQRKLSDRIEDVGRKNELYTKLVQQQQNDLQRLTGMST